MDLKNILILILLLLFLIFIFLFINKIWIFKNKNIIKIKHIKEGDCKKDLEQCTCQIEVEKEDNTVEKKNVTSFNMEKDYYKVKQDLIPYWSNWNQCDAYGFKKRHRIIDTDESKYDTFDHNGKISINDNDSDKYYKLYSCDLIPCENYGLNDDGINICKTFSEVENANNLINVKRCNPIMTFQNNTDINNYCSDINNILPLHQVWSDNISLYYNPKNSKNENFNYGYYQEKEILIGEFDSLK